MKKTNYEIIQEIKNIDKNKTIEIVINKCYGGFSVSKKVCEILGITEEEAYSLSENRGNPKLVEVVKTLGEQANGIVSELEIIEISMEEVLTAYLKDFDGKERIVYEIEDGVVSLLSII